MEIVKSSMKRTDETKFTEVLNLFCWQYFIYDQNSNLSNEDYRFKEKICRRRANPDEVTKELLSTKGTLIYQLLKVFEVLVTAEFGENVKFLLINYDPANRQTYEALKSDASLRDKSSKYITKDLLVRRH